MIDTMFLFFLFVLILGNSYTTYKLFKSDKYEKNQKKYQLIIIWAIPFMGALLVVLFLKDISTKPFKNNNRTNNYDADFNGGGDAD